MLETEGAGYSPAGYGEVLAALRRAGYRFGAYEGPLEPGPVVLLRHDVDFSPAWAVDLAHLNVEHEARGTFFLQLRSPLYNLHAFETLEAVEALRAAEQWIGFHVTLPEGELAPKERAELVERDFETARRLVPDLQPVFAWHNPSLLMSDEGLDQEIPGFVNAYGRIGGGNVRYVSDSNLRYTREQLLALVAGGETPLQLALAPMQWLPGAPDMPGILAHTLSRKVRDLEVEFLRNHVYRAALPQGLPGSLLGRFESAVEGALRRP